MNSDELKDNLAFILDGYGHDPAITPEAYANAHVAIMLNELNWTLTFMKTEVKKQSEYTLDMSEDVSRIAKGINKKM